MTRLAVRGSPVYSFDEGNTVIADGAVIVSDGRIEAVGPWEELERQRPFDRILGGEGFFVMPGLVNAHHHSIRALRRAISDEPFERRNCMLNFAAVPEEDLYYAVLYAALQLIRNGITGCIDHFYGRPGMEDLGVGPALEAYHRVGLRVAFGLTARDQNGYVHGDNEAFLATVPADLAAQVRASRVGYLYDTEEVVEVIRRWAARYHRRDNRIMLFACPDWSPTSSEGLYRRLKSMARELDTGIHMHLLETKYEMLYHHRTFGETAVQHLKRIGFLGPELSCGHTAWVSRVDIPILADTGVTAVHNPGSNLHLYSGISPVRAMVDGGVRVACGLDAHSLSDDSDMIADLRLADRLQRTPGIRQERIPVSTLFRAATVHGAYAATAGGPVGPLVKGNRADMLLVSKERLYREPYLDPSFDPLEVLLYRGNGSDVDTVIVEGKPLMEGRRLLTVDEGEAYRRVTDAAVRYSQGNLESRHILELAAQLEPFVLAWYDGWDEAEMEPHASYNAARVHVPASVGLAAPGETRGAQ